MKRPLALALSSLPIAAATLVLLLVPTGCGPIGCFPAERAGGTCPAEADALPFFGDPDCGGTVASVDSEPSLRNGTPEEGALCCYAITTQDEDFTGCPDF
ncbi:MAG: hypothetical protein R3B70_04395 [Polyangiaceae bacterium]